MRSWISAFVVACACLPGPAEAQEARGTLQGRVFDASGAAVPGATVEVTNVDTGVVHADHVERGRQLSRAVPQSRHLPRHRHARRLQQVRQPEHPAPRRRRAHRGRDAATRPPDRRSHRICGRHRHRFIRLGLGQVVDARRISELPIREGTAVELVILAPGVQNTTDLRSRKAAFNNGLSQWSSDGAGEKRNDFTIDGVANVAGGSRRLQSAVGGGRGVQDPDGLLRRRGRQHDGRVGEPGHQERHQQPARAGLRMVPRREARRQQLLRQKNGRPKRDYNDNRFGAAVGGPIREAAPSTSPTSRPIRSRCRHRQR